MAFTFESSGELTPPTPEELARADEDTSILVCTDGTLGDGSPYWAYLAVKPSKYDEFREAARVGRPILLSEFGVLLKYGCDAAVPEAVKEEMQRDHGFDERYVKGLVERARKEQAAFLEQKEKQRLNDIVALLKKKQGST